MTRRSASVPRFPVFWRGAHLSKLGLSYFFDGEFRGAERRKAEGHVAACAKCKGELATLKYVQKVSRAAYARRRF